MKKEYDENVVVVFKNIGDYRDRKETLNVFGSCAKEPMVWIVDCDESEVSRVGGYPVPRDVKEAISPNTNTTWIRSGGNKWNLLNVQTLGDVFDSVFMEHVRHVIHILQFAGVDKVEVVASESQEEISAKDDSVKGKAGVKKEFVDVHGKIGVRRLEKERAKSQLNQVIKTRFGDDDPKKVQELLKRYRLKGDTKLEIILDPWKDYFDYEFSSDIFQEKKTLVKVALNVAVKIPSVPVAVDVDSEVERVCESQRHLWQSFKLHLERFGSK